MSGGMCRWLFTMCWTRRGRNTGRMKAANVSTFSLSAEICDTGTGLTVSVRDPCPGLSAKGEERAVTAVADMVAQYLENELMINRRCFVQDRHYAV